MKNVLQTPKCPFTISFLITYRLFIRSHLVFHTKLEPLYYNATLAKTGTKIGSSTDKSCEKRSLESLKSSCWYKELSFLYKVLKIESSPYLFNAIPNSNTQN